MSQTIMMIVLVGALIVGFIKRCDWLGICGDDLGLDEIISEFNSLPTLLDNPKTNEYRSTTMSKVNREAFSKTLKDQSDFSNPKTAAAVKKYVATTNKNTAAPKTPPKTGPAKSGGYNCGSVLCNTYPNICPLCAKSKFTRVTSLFTTSRVAI